MRTTLSLDDDVTSLLQKEIRRSGASFKDAVNHYLRLGLMASNRPARKKFVVRPRPLGLPQGLSYDNVEEQAAALEGALTEGQAAGPPSKRCRDRGADHRMRRRPAHPGSRLRPFPGFAVGEPSLKNLSSVRPLAAFTTLCTCACAPSAGRPCRKRPSESRAYSKPRR